jgi:hypothetical protein
MLKRLQYEEEMSAVACIGKGNTSFCDLPREEYLSNLTIMAAKYL